MADENDTKQLPDILARVIAENTRAIESFTATLERMEATAASSTTGPTAAMSDLADRLARVESALRDTPAPGAPRPATTTPRPRATSSTNDEGGSKHVVNLVRVPIGGEATLDGQKVNLTFTQDRAGTATIEIPAGETRELVIRARGFQPARHSVGGEAGKTTDLTGDLELA